MSSTKRVILATCVFSAAVLAASCGGRSTGFGDIPEGGQQAIRLGGQSLYFEGEFLSWALTWKGVVAARSQLAVGEAGQLDGKPALVIKSQSRRSELTAMLSDSSEEVTTVVDIDSGAPMNSVTLDTDDGDLDKVTTEFFEGKLVTEIEPQKGASKKWTTELASKDLYAYERHTMLAMLRAWMAPAKTVGTFFMESGRSYYKVRVMAVGEEKLRTQLGGFDTFRIDGQAVRLTQDGKSDTGQAPTRRFSLWFTSDDRRLPVQFRAETRFGDVFATLDDFRQDAARAIRVDDTD